jgi:hypothetical protein
MSLLVVRAKKRRTETLVKCRRADKAEGNEYSATQVGRSLHPRARDLGLAPSLGRKGTALL